jgi:hypothetical protein
MSPLSLTAALAADPAAEDLDPADRLHPAERHRRRALHDADDLLDQIEHLRMAGVRACPATLAEAIRRLHLRLGRVDGGRPRTVRAAHGLVFAAQARLMAANPRLPRPRPQPERPVGVSRISVLRQGGGAWKFLALPPPPPADDASALLAWRSLIEETVGRALDRWASAQDQAVAAAREREGALAALHRARAAWRNYWDLRCEADGLMARARRLPAAHRIEIDGAGRDR